MAEKNVRERSGVGYLLKDLPAAPFQPYIWPNAPGSGYSAGAGSGFPGPFIHSGPQGPYSSTVQNAYGFGPGSTSAVYGVSQDPRLIPALLVIGGQIIRVFRERQSLAIALQELVAPETGIDSAAVVWAVGWLFYYGVIEYAPMEQADTSPRLSLTDLARQFL